MPAPLPMRLILALSVTIVLTTPLNATRRGTRVDAGAWSDEKAFGSADCPGTYPLSGNAAASLPLDWGTFRFYGIGDTTYTHQMYCQFTLPDLFNGDTFEFAFPAEPGLRTIIGSNTDNTITGIRYTWMTQDFVFDGPSFQWAFYSFPNGVTIVALYGLIDPSDDSYIPLDGSTAIKQWGNTVWSADPGYGEYDGEYFCFVNGEFAGIWFGDVNTIDDVYNGWAEESACLEAATLFRGSFE